MIWSKPFKSEALDLMIKRSASGHIYTEDKVIYLPEEIEIIAETTGEVDKLTHMVKKVFDGEIVLDRQRQIP